MPPQQSHLPQDRATYIPPAIQHEMAQHMQQTLPANLKYYQKSGAYVPPHIQHEMAQHMQQSMPEHLKPYINPYMQQQIVPQHLATTPGGQAPHVGLQPPVTAHPGLDQPVSFDPRHRLQNPDSLTQQIQPSIPAHTVEPSATSQDPYGFITEPAAQKASTSLPFTLKGIGGSQALPMRLAVMGAGLLLVLILIVAIKGIVVGGFKLEPFVAVLQDQQELIHLTNSSTQSQASQANLPLNDQNFLATTQLTVSSAQTQLLAYLTHSKQKVTTKELNGKVSAAVQTQLTTAQSNGDYVTVFQSILSNLMNIYQADLRSAYSATTGKNGRAELRYDYNQAQLLNQQLNQGASSASS